MKLSVNGSSFRKTHGYLCFPLKRSSSCLIDSAASLTSLLRTSMTMTAFARGPSERSASRTVAFPSLSARRSMRSFVEASLRGWASFAARGSTGRRAEEALNEKVRI